MTYPWPGPVDSLVALEETEVGRDGRHSAVYKNHIKYKLLLVAESIYTVVCGAGPRRKPRRGLRLFFSGGDFRLNLNLCTKYVVKFCDSLEEGGIVRFGAWGGCESQPTDWLW